MLIAGETNNMRITRSVQSILSIVSVLCVLAPRGLAAQAGPTDHLIPWNKLLDSYSVRKRPLQQTMVMKVYGDRYMIDAAKEGEWLTRAPGSYDGVTIQGIDGRPPQVKPLLGNINKETPDPEFYSVLGVGSSLRKLA